jgi:hypothetical protein
MKYISNVQYLLSSLFLLRLLQDGRIEFSVQCSVFNNQGILDAGCSSTAN